MRDASALLMSLSCIGRAFRSSRKKTLRWSWRSMFKSLPLTATSLRLLTWLSNCVKRAICTKFTRRSASHWSANLLTLILNWTITRGSWSRITKTQRKKMRKSLSWRKNLASSRLSLRSCRFSLALCRSITIRSKIRSLNFKWLMMKRATNFTRWTKHGTIWKPN